MNLLCKMFGWVDGKWFFDLKKLMLEQSVMCVMEIGFEVSVCSSMVFFGVWGCVNLLVGMISFFLL